MYPHSSRSRILNVLSMFCAAATGCFHDKSSWSSSGRASHRDRLARRLMFVRDQYGSDPVMKERFRPTLYTNTSTGDAPNDPARDPPETRRECQCVVKVTPRCTHKVTKEVYDEVRPELRDPRSEERGSRSLGRPSASEPHKDPSKAILHRSKSSPTCRTLKVHQGRPFAAHAAEESSSERQERGAGQA